MGKMRQYADTITSYVKLYQLVSGGGIVGVGLITVYVAKATTWLNGYGAIGWWSAGLVGALLAALVLAALAGARYLWEYGASSRRWSRTAEKVNPLDPVFTGKRIELAELTNPFSRLIEGKTFTNCELMGPANVLFMGGEVNGTGFYDCCFVVVRQDAIISPRMFTFLKNSKIFGGAIWNCIIYITPDMAEQFKDKGINFINA